MLLPALPYHLKVLDHFKQYPKVWDFFAAAGTKEEQLATYKTELLKNASKSEPGSDPLIYDKIGLAKERLGLGALSVTAYQARDSNDHDHHARIVYLHPEAHLVLSGNLVQRLDDKELLALIAHELTHIKLYMLRDGELEVADRIITAIRLTPSGETRLPLAPYAETARRWRLYTDIYCDRGASIVLEDTTPVISLLSKITPGSASVHADATPHPENILRAQALRLWHKQKEAAEPAITQMIEGVPELDRLDIFVQKELAELTREFLQLYLSPPWFHSTLVKDLAGQYFPAGITSDKAASTAERSGSPQQEPGSAGPSVREQITATISVAHDSVKEYFSYLLLDFALVDPSLEEAPSGRAFQFAEEMQLAAPYASIVKKELQLSDKKLQQYRQQVLTAYAAVNSNQ
jgi:hypothetical protein